MKLSELFRFGRRGRFTLYRWSGPQSWREAVRSLVPRVYRYRGGTLRYYCWWRFELAVLPAYRDSSSESQP